MKRLILLVLTFGGLLSACTAIAHEVRPALLQITETTSHGYEVLWKQPLMGEMAIHLVPHLSGGWLEGKPTTVELSSNFAIEKWVIPAADTPGMAGALDGQTVSIEGLENTITDALVMVRRADGSEWQSTLTPAYPSRLLRAGTQSRGSIAFFGLGIEHILTGLDHLLFVLGLLLIVGNRWTLLKTITAFTLAHSITLAAATLGYASAPVPFVNAAIALSILFLGAEVVRRWRGQTSFTLRHPWAVAFLFGLLHGFGFASGLTALGLPSRQVTFALLLFNVGVEVGQLAFVSLILWLQQSFRVLAIRWPRRLQQFPGYLVGTLGAFWTVQRVLVLFAGPS